MDANRDVFTSKNRQRGRPRPADSFRSLERETGRHREHLKRWYGIYSAYQDFDEFLEKYGKPRAEAWAKKILVSRKAIPQLETKIPSGKFTVIYADPPWQYEFSQSDSRSIEAHYRTLSTEGICAMEVPADDNAVLFLWAPAPKLEDALAVMEAWAFDYRTHFVWVKDKIGMGYWARAQHELLLVGTRGEVSPPEENARYSSIFNAPRLEHSAKPPLVYEMIEAMFPNQTRIELFARGKPREGWVFWGNETGPQSGETSTNAHQSEHSRILGQGGPVEDSNRQASDVGKGDLSS